VGFPTKMLFNRGERWTSQNELPIRLQSVFVFEFRKMQSNLLNHSLIVGYS